MDEARHHGLRGDTAAGRWPEVFAAFLRLGLTAFGGPVAHLGYFRDEFVVRRRWLDEAAYADLVALCQFLPGPASSQVGIALGLRRAGTAGTLAAWTGFTLPSAAAMALFASGAMLLDGPAGRGALHGLKAAAAAVVALAILGMMRSLAPDRPRATLAVAAAAIALALPGVAGQLAALVLGGLAGLALPGQPAPSAGAPAAAGPVGRRTALACLGLFALLLAGLPLAAEAAGSPGLTLFALFFRAGALVFGGGHVVLPLLQAELVPHLVGADAFLAGYGAVQAMPGPLFTLAAYLGAVAGGPAGAAAALAGIFLPSFLLVFGTLPFWGRLRGVPRARRALAGVNAAVVGLLLAAFYDPVWTAGITDRAAYAVAAAAFLLLFLWRAPPWLVVGVSAGAGALLAG
ncbi:chromate efflux transporter [Methylobacterium oryzihabitans]|uniref:Chromate efflux transporter n=1 Tax=Methylobacterium oryzihabitans TaxID=2499852 RepID=A0A3S2YVF4_9HYPH|nr:chromate efflux transporter [Methylobacterium oryzihabitans]RVU20131.1 chromate efflux transporter [Methylobacterium oryzihabitans]